MILAIDTSVGTSVALVGDGIVAEAGTLDTRSHAEHVGVFIERVLTDADVRPSQVTAVVAGLGPGPFTGLRVGIAAAIAFSVGGDIPLYGVPSHDAVAVGRGNCTVVTDVRRRELAWTSYRDGVAIGGAALTGGRGNVRGTMLGAFVIGFLSAGLVISLPKRSECLQGRRLHRSALVRCRRPRSSSNSLRHRKHQIRATSDLDRKSFRLCK